MEAEDGTGSRRPSWRCGNVTSPIPFDISSEQLRLLTFLFIYQSGGVYVNAYEKLQEEACRDGIEVIHYPFETDRIKGLYCDGTIAISTSMKTDAEKACVLAEELGHHYTSYGNILDQSDTSNRKQELRARAWAYNKQIGLLGLIRAYEHGCQNRFEIAEYLEVTEEVLEECLIFYRNKYGVCANVDNYVVYFIPNLVIMKRI